MTGPGDIRAQALAQMKAAFDEVEQLMAGWGDEEVAEHAEELLTMREMVNVDFLTLPNLPNLGENPSAAEYREAFKRASEEYLRGFEAFGGGEE